MAKKAETTTAPEAAQAIPDGTIIHFKGYTPGEDGAVPDGNLKPGDKIKIVGYDAKQETYNVVSCEDENVTDSLFPEEFEVPGAQTAPAPTVAATEAPAPAPARKVATKKVSAPKVEKVDYIELGTKADAGDEEAMTALTEAAEAKSLNIDDYPESWASLAAVLDNPALLEESEEAEEEIAEEETPAPAPAATTRTRTPRQRSETPKTTGKQQQQQEEEEVLLPYKKTASVDAAMKEHGGNILAAARAIADSRDKSTYVLGGILAYAKRNKTHLLLTENDKEGNPVPIYSDDLAGFNAWMNDEVGVQPRNGNYYIDIYEVFSQVTTESKIAGMGWTKLRELLPARRILTKENVGEFLAFAKGHATKDVVGHVREKLVEAGVELHGRQKTSNMKTFKFSAFDDQAEVIHKAFDQCKAKLGADATDGQVWNQIATDWLAFNSPEQA